MTGYRAARFWAAFAVYAAVLVVAAIGIAYLCIPAGPLWGSLLTLAASLAFGFGSARVALPLMFRAGGGRLPGGWVRRGLAGLRRPEQ